MTDQVGRSSGARPEQRRHERLELPADTRAVLRNADGVEQEVRVKDISASGAGLVADIPLDNNAFIELHIDGMAPISGRVARKFVEGMGVEFDLSERKKNKMEEEVRKFRLAVARKEF